MSYQPQFIITPALLARVEQIAALRERILSRHRGSAVDSSIAKGHPDAIAPSPCALAAMCRRRPGTFRV